MANDKAVLNTKLDTTLARAESLDALSAILPFDRREQLAELLTDDDIATLKHLAKQGMGRNSLRALTSDLSYLEAWSMAATANPLPCSPARAASTAALRAKILV